MLEQGKFVHSRILRESSHPCTASTPYSPVWCHSTAASLPSSTRIFLDMNLGGGGGKGGAIPLRDRGAQGGRDP